MFRGILSLLAAGTGGRGVTDDSGVGTPVGDGDDGPVLDAADTARRLEDVIDEEIDDESTRAALKVATGDALEDLARDPNPGTELAVDDGDGSVPLNEFVEAFPHGVYVVDADHTVLAYNSMTKRGIGLDPDHTDFLGTDGRETFSVQTYGEDSHQMSFPHEIVEHPHDADEAHGAKDLSHLYPHEDVTIYGDRRVFTNGEGEEQHIESTGVPVFDDDGELELVVEVVRDRTREINRQRSIEDLVTVITETVRAIGRGDLAARAEFEDELGVVDEDLLDVVTEVNQMAADFQALIERVDEKANNLTASIERATESAYRIDQQVVEQNESFEVVANEMDDFSATMEEVAASAKEVADAAEGALEEADRGVEAGEGAREATDEVLARSEALVETVEELDAHMDQIGEVAEVIAEVADQTNLLALNANIEAARAGESGKGFAVVADEVKALATETRSHTEEIAALIESIQAQTSETVEEVEASHDRIEAVDGEIVSAVESLRTISDEVGSAAAGIQSVADANDEQAVTVEEVSSTIDSSREYAENVSRTVERIVEEAEKQERAVTELAASVAELSTGDE